MKDKLGGFGGLIKGLDGLMPQDSNTTDTGAPKPRASVNKSANKNIKDLRAQAHELYAHIGQMVVEQNGPDGFGDVSQQLQQVLTQIQNEESKIREAEQAKMREQQAHQGITCPNCGTLNAPGVNFCQECGSKLAVPSKTVCPQCGQESPPNTRFCGSCGTKLSG